MLLLIRCRIKFVFSTCFVLFGVFPEDVWNIIYAILGMLVTMQAAIYNRTPVQWTSFVSSSFESFACVNVCEATLDNTHVVSHCCGKVGDHRSIKREWLHRIKSRDCGTGKHINLLRKGLAAYYSGKLLSRIIKNGASNVFAFYRNFPEYGRFRSHVKIMGNVW